MEEIAIIDQLEMLRIKPEDQIPSHEFLFRWNGTPCFARGELVAVGGKAKSGKTYLCSTLLSLASFTGACIVCVLHQNKSAEDKTLRGALGTELMNKCFESYECKKDDETLIFSVSQQATRKYDVRGKLNFIIDENGLPKQCGHVESVTKETRSYNPYHFNEKYLLPAGKGQLNLRALMQFAFGDQKPLRLAQIIEIVRHEANVQSYSLAEKIVRNAVGEHLIENIPTLGLDIFRLATPDLFTHQQGPQ